MTTGKNIVIGKIVHISVCEKWLHAPGYRESYRLFSVTRGSLRMWTADGTVTVNSGQCVFLAPITRIRSCHSEDEGVEFFEIDFELSSTPRFKALTLYNVNNNACALLSLVSSDSADNSSLLNIFIGLAVKNPAVKSNELAIADAVCDYIEENARQSIDVDTVADAFGYDRSHISRVFKQATGKNLKTYINEKRVAYILGLLEFSDYTINKIASMTGFDNSNLFTKFFIYHKRLTPSDYRRKLHGIPTIHKTEE